jgi:hypothetical protein
MLFTPLNSIRFISDTARILKRDKNPTMKNEIKAGRGFVRGIIKNN